jgi:putative endonuclease
VDAGANRHLLGRQGEALAASWYCTRGFCIVARNWRTARGEIDLICTRGELVVFCEVKARSSDAFGCALEAVTPRKQRRIRALAGMWLAGQPHYWPRVRFDVASVDRFEVQVVPGAF